MPSAPSIPSAPSAPAGPGVPPGPGAPIGPAGPTTFQTTRSSPRRQPRPSSGMRRNPLALRHATTWSLLELDDATAIVVTVSSGNAARPPMSQRADCFMTPTSSRPDRPESRFVDVIGATAHRLRQEMIRGCRSDRQTTSYGVKARVSTSDGRPGGRIRPNPGFDPSSQGRVRAESGSGQEAIRQCRGDASPRSTRCRTRTAAATRRRLPCSTDR